MKVFSKLYSYLFIGMCLIHTANFQADSIADIPNYLQYNNLFASSGQPNEIQLQLLADSGVQQIIYLAFTDNKTAIANEDRMASADRSVSRIMNLLLTMLSENSFNAIINESDISHSP